MIDTEKRDFMAVMTTIADLYDKTIKPERVAVYWEALKHRGLGDVRAALNKHVQDAERGRFFPLPADVSAQLPAERNPWLDADEAWAMCPKDESVSAAMSGEMAQALGVASDLIAAGDLVAARMAFKAAYTRLMTEAKDKGESPKWFASLGQDKDGRHEAEVKVVQMRNLARPESDQLALPSPQEGEAIPLEQLLDKDPRSDEDIEKGRLAIAKMKESMRMPE